MALIEFQAPVEIIPDLFKKSEKGQYLLIIADEADLDSFTKLKEASQDFSFESIVYAVGSSESSTFEAMNEASLKKLANELSAPYIPLTNSSDDTDRIRSKLRPYYPENDSDDIPFEDFGYYLLLTISPISLLMFRKGWSVEFLLAATILLIPKVSWLILFLDMWLTKDQQGMILFKMGNYKEAAHSFSNEMWKGTSYYVAEQFEDAEKAFSRAKGDEARFNRANAIAQMGYYQSAYEIYIALQKKYPDEEKYKINAKITKKLADDIEALSKSQVSEGEEKAKTFKSKFKKSKGASRLIYQKDTKKTDPGQMNEKNIAIWLDNVGASLEGFLTQKFGVIANERN